MNDSVILFRRFRVLGCSLEKCTSVLYVYVAIRGPIEVLLCILNHNRRQLHYIYNSAELLESPRGASCA